MQGICGEKNEGLVKERDKRKERKKNGEMVDERNTGKGRMKGRISEG